MNTLSPEVVDAIAKGQLLAMDIHYPPSFNFTPTSLDGCYGALALAACLKSVFDAAGICVGTPSSEGTIGDGFLMATVNDRAKGLRILCDLARRMGANDKTESPIKVAWRDENEGIWRCVLPHSGVRFDHETRNALRVAAGELFNRMLPPH